MAAKRSVIEEGKHVILKKSDNLRLFQIHRNRDVWLDKNKFTLDGIIGHRYGTLFEVKDGQMVKVNRTVNVLSDSSDKADMAGLETEKDNRHLLDTDSNQKLTQEEIERMKREGVSGSELIEQLIENSVTFQSKTGYAQEKWVKKKKKKHLLQFTVLKPTSRLLCEMQWSKGPTRICNLRIESLAQMLTMSNVHADSTVMVVDTCLGLVTGAVLERLGGFGKIISFYHGDSPIRPSLVHYDFPQSVMDTLYSFPLELVNSLKHSCKKECETDVKQAEVDKHLALPVMQSEAQSPADESLICQQSGCEELLNIKGKLDDKNSAQLVMPTNEMSKVHSVDVEDSTVCEQSNCSEMVHIDTDKIEVCSNLVPINNNDNQVKNEGEECVKFSDNINNEKAEKWKKKRNGRKDQKDRIEAKQARAEEIEAAREIISKKNIDCLIVASKFHPTPIVMALIDFVAPSRQIVVFSQFIEALQDCYMSLREHKGLVNYRLTETWLREYQVLPNRTHPMIQMSGTGGYLLSATTVIRPGTQ